MATEPIYVFMPNEAVDVWAPVDAEQVDGDLYRILDCRGEDGELQFGKGAVVRCRWRSLSEGECLVAEENPN
ncbi:MAG TPA: hypothetical protein VHY79_12055 [Rhizomicrobium sp.]|nr:hypothetical protein [Rhizomicrobium sp.]